MIFAIFTSSTGFKLSVYAALNASSKPAAVREWKIAFVFGKSNPPTYLAHCVHAQETANADANIRAMAKK
jgi:hypothetical protein